MVPPPFSGCSTMIDFIIILSPGNTLIKLLRSPLLHVTRAFFSFPPSTAALYFFFSLHFVADTVQLSPCTTRSAIRNSIWSKQVKFGDHKCQNSSSFPGTHSLVSQCRTILPDSLFPFPLFLILAIERGNKNWSRSMCLDRIPRPSGSSLFPCVRFSFSS